MSPSPYLQDSDFTLFCGDSREVLSTLPAESVHMCVTSPPFFGLRDYGMDGQIGLEETPEAWVAQLVAVFEEVRRVLRKDGTLWVECGDSYAAGGNGPGAEGAKQGTNVGALLPRKAAPTGYKQKDLLGQPFALAFALREAGWYWRNVCVWSKPNSMPESVRDRFSVSHSYVLLFSKSPRYFMDMEAVREPHSPDGRRETSVVGGDQSLQHRNGERWPNGGRNARTVWTLPTEPLSLSVRSVRQVRVAADEAAYGMTRTTSPDCPVHAGLPDGVHTAPDGEREAAPLSRSERSDDRPAQAPVDGSEATSLQNELAAAPGTEDSPALGSPDAATPHSTASSRTDLALATSSPGSASAQIPDHTGGTSASPESVEPQPSKPESRTGPDDSLEDDPSERTAGDTARICTCSYTGEITENTGHYAAFPQALAERCIKAGTSERGCCPECGAPWVREVELSAEYRARLVQRERPEPLGAWLRERRLAKGKRQGEVAALFPSRSGGLTGCVSNWELDKNIPTSEQWLALKDALSLGDEKDTLLEAWHEWERSWESGGLASGKSGRWPTALNGSGQTLSWRPSCECNAGDPIPASVLDCFLGSGTTALVSRRLGRRCIGVELNERYCELAAKRTQQLSLEVA